MCKLAYNTHLPFIKRVVEGSFPLSVLDLGAHDGSLSDYLTSINPFILYKGLEINPLQIAKAKSFKRNVEYADLGTGIPCVDGSYDVIIASEIIEHIADTDFFLKECHRVLKKGGSLLLFTVNVAEFNSRLKLLFGYKPNSIDYCGKLGPSHVRAFTVSDLKKLCIINSLNVEECRGADFWFCYMDVHTFILGSLLSKVAYFFPTLSADLYICCRK